MTRTTGKWQRTNDRTRARAARDGASVRQRACTTHAAVLRTDSQPGWARRFRAADSSPSPVRRSRGLCEKAASSMMRIGMRGSSKNICRSRDLDDLAGIDDGDAVAVMGGDADVAGDEQHRGAALADQLADELQHLRLDGHVEPAGGIVGDHQPRRADQRDGDHDALRHAAARARADRRRCRRSGSGMLTVCSMSSALADRPRAAEPR